MMIAKTDKASLRSRLIQQRNFLYNRESKEQIDKKLLPYFEDLINEKSPTKVGLYKNFGSELDTSHLDLFLRKNNIEVYYPKIQDNEMIFIRSNSINDLAKGENGFLEPATSSPIGIPDCIITPSLAVDKDLYRLGYGKGYYDRYIAKNPSYYVSIILKNFQVDTLPREAWDSKINKVIAISVPPINIVKKQTS
jgi:5-formyltetrahydrofolate cyclo-ligase